MSTPSTSLTAELTKSESTVEGRKITPLMLACAKGSLIEVEMLLMNNANINEEDMSDEFEHMDQVFTAFLYAALHNRLDVVELLLKHDPKLIEKHTKTEDTAVHAAAMGGALETLKYLISKSPNSYKKANAYEESALTLAAAYDHLPVVKYLVELDRAEFENFDALFAIRVAAANNESTDVLKYLISVYPDKFDWEEVFEIATQNSNQKTLAFLLENDYSPAKEIEGGANNNVVDAGDKKVSKEEVHINPELLQAIQTGDVETQAVTMECSDDLDNDELQPLLFSHKPQKGTKRPLETAQPLDTLNADQGDKKVSKEAEKLSFSMDCSDIGAKSEKLLFSRKPSKKTPAKPPVRAPHLDTPDYTVSFHFDEMPWEIQLCRPYKKMKLV